MRSAEIQGMKFLLLPSNRVFASKFIEKQDTNVTPFPWHTELDPVKTVWPQLKNAIGFKHGPLAERAKQ